MLLLLENIWCISYNGTRCNIIPRDISRYQETEMPEISRFLGIAILMYFNDRNQPHFYVKYNEQMANIVP